MVRWFIVRQRAEGRGNRIQGLGQRTDDGRLMTGRRQLEPKGRGAENGRLKVDDGVQEKKPES